MIQRTVGAVVVTLGLAARLLAAEPSTLDDLIKRRAETLIEESGVVGLAVGVVDEGQTHAVCVGHRSSRGPATDQRTLFEIGSVTKTFTGLLLADAVVRGTVKLEQPVSELLPSNTVVPKFAEQPIRLVDLATQTSGLPRLPTNLVPFNPFNPYAYYQVDDLYKFLAGHELTRAPGKEYEYSNLGMGLLGHALARQAGKTYEELLNERICGPLGMTDTAITLSKDQASRLASGTFMFGLPAMNWDLPAIPGCGAVRSSLRDMLIYLRANLSGTTPLAKAIALAHEPRFTIREANATFPDKLEIGLAWHITTDAGDKIVWHDGMTGGYAAFVALVPGKHWGVVVLGNRATSEVDQFGNGLLKDMLKGNLPRDEEPAKGSAKRPE